MKKIIFIISLLGMLVSCERFLDKTPYDSVGTSTDLVSSDAIALVNAAYQPLQWPKLYNMRIWSTDVVAGESSVGAGGGTDGIETVQLSNFTADPSNAAATDVWRANPGILRANLALDVLPRTEMDADLRTRLMAECYFLRAHYHFILVRFFGDIPLRTKPLFATDELNIARTPKEKVYEQIISDCEEAIKGLPYKAQYSSSDLGRACREAAECMLAKVYLTLGVNYGEVVNLCKDIEDQGYDLSKMAYADNWYNPETGKLNQNGPESLFEIQYTGDPAASTNWLSDNDNQSQWLNCFMAPRNSNFVGGGGYGWQHVSQHFVDAYEPGDLRKDVTIFYDGCPDFDGKEYDPEWSTTGYNVRKWCVPVSVCDKVDNCPANIVVYRFADVLLMKAEALNEQGLTDDARIPLNKVRQRAGLSDIPAGKTKAEMKEIIIHERRMELAFEGHRWFDMIRIDGGDYAVKFLHSIGKKNATKDRLLYPVPQVERDANPLFEQNPGY
ncbi:MAG: RagB/SusD family nutrient uptake outer membrane protein [Bacteroidales bacterium]|nr:RagB/SusD family nutrient uptake outer membrane protein [Bacteroidales bacterium]